MADIVERLNQAADSLDRNNGGFYAPECREARTEIDRLRKQVAMLRKALTFVRDIEKPMVGDHPATDWLGWYSTSSQQSERADDALSATADLDGYVLVPREPTEAMQAAGRDKLAEWLPDGRLSKRPANQWEPSNEIYRAMIGEGE